MIDVTRDSPTRNLNRFSVALVSDDSAHNLPEMPLLQPSIRYMPTEMSHPAFITAA